MLIKILRSGKTDVYISRAPRGLTANTRKGSSSFLPIVEMAGLVKRLLCLLSGMGTSSSWELSRTQVNE